MIIKALLIAALMGASAFAVRGPTGPTNLALRRLVAIGFVGLGIVAVIVPNLVTWTAQLVGVRRGTDLLVYLLVIAFIFVSMSLHQKIHSLETRIADLTRAHALDSADRRADRAAVEDAVR
jgi:hypothetical protein